MYLLSRQATAVTHGVSLGSTVQQPRTWAWGRIAQGLKPSAAVFSSFVRGKVLNLAKPQFSLL